MSESQEDIDALLAEVNALAEEAVADIVGSESEPAQSAVAAPAAELDAAPAQRRPASQAPIASSLSAMAGGEDLTRILQLEVPVIVQLARNTMSLANIVNWTTGAIIEFDKPADSELELMINNKCIGHGQAVKVGENFGLRISTIGSLHDRITAMGGK